MNAPTVWGQTPPAAAAADSGHFSGKVVETMNAASYTYVLVDTGVTNLWAAAPQFSVKVGDTVTIGEAMPMPRYHSQTLNRDFPLVYFTGEVQVKGTSAPAPAQAIALPKNHPPLTGTMAKPAVDLSGIKKADGGRSIAEIYADREKLRGQQVKVRGRVVKYNADIMGKNWLHIQDGTGQPPNHDLTVTTAAVSKVGDTVLVTGVVALDRDFGAGYRYKLILEDAQVTVE